MKQYKYKLYGAILGDLAGQPFEFKKYTKPFQIHNPDSHITDDTLMTLATAKAIMKNTTPEYEYKAMGDRYEGDYYGKGFKRWLQQPLGTINDSYGNGCLMRISPFMYLPNEKLLRELVIASCMQSHNHPKSLIASLGLCNLYAEAGLRKNAGRFNPTVEKFARFEVAADKTLDFIDKAYWITNSTVDTIEQVVACGGDTDTNASIVGELMNYTFKDLDREDTEYVESKLDPYLMSILRDFNNILW